MIRIKIKINEKKYWNFIGTDNNQVEIINESNKKYAKQRIDSTIGAIGLLENEREKNY